MFELNITKETNDFLKKIRKELKQKGYKQSKSRTNRYLGGMHLNYAIECFIKGNLIFEIEKDLNYNTIITRLYYKNEIPKQIMLADVLDLA